MMEAGLITPPVGLNVYTLAGVARDVPMEEIFRGAFPFLISIIAIVIIVTVFPKIALFLPGMMGR
jgi:TRAP-type C4-dicarboxylate transport system permease large subunit